MRLLHFSASSRGKWGFPSRGGWPRLLISLASPIQRVPRSFAFFAKEGVPRTPAAAKLRHPIWNEIFVQPSFTLTGPASSKR